MQHNPFQFEEENRSLPKAIETVEDAYLLRELALESSVLYEVVQIPDDVTIEDLAQRLIHCSRALSLANKLPAKDKKRALSMTMVNFNKVRAAYQRLLKKEGVEVKE